MTRSRLAYRKPLPPPPIPPVRHFEVGSAIELIKRTLEKHGLTFIYKWSAGNWIYLLNTGKRLNRAGLFQLADQYRVEDGLEPLLTNGAKVRNMRNTSR